MFNSKHFFNNLAIGSHCASTALQNVCSYNNLFLSEDMIFGLGCGLGFSYYKLPEMPLYAFSGRSRNIEKTFARITGLTVEHCYNETPESLWEKWVLLLDQGYPLILHLDMNTLTYLREKFQLPATLAFSDHLAVLTGIEGDYGYICEYYQKQQIQVPREEILYSISRSFERKALHSNYYYFKSPFAMISIPLALRHALYVNSHEMLFGFGVSLGVGGMKRFFIEMSKWRKLMDADTLKANYRVMHFSFEQLGNGGGNFRRMYARFLYKASEIFKDPVLKNIADTYADLSLLWKKFSHMMYSFSQAQHIASIDINENCGKLISEIQEQEKNAVENLYNWSLNNYSVQKN